MHFIELFVYKLVEIRCFADVRIADENNFEVRVASELTILTSLTFYRLVRGKVVKCVVSDLYAPYCLRSSILDAMEAR